MKKHPFRVLAMSMALLLPLSAFSQVSKSSSPSQRINPATNHIVSTPAHPAVVTPGTGTTVPPVIPPGGMVIVNPGYVVPGSTIMPVVPRYPSGWIGPTVVRETHSEPAPAPPPNTTGAINTQMPALRLVALLGSLERTDPATGTDLGLTEPPLAVSVGALAGYAQNPTVRASGDFFGTCWDGPTFFSRSEDAKHGPYLEHPIVTVNEFKPGPWEFEAGVSNRRLSWIRVAIDVFEDASHGEGKPVNLPHGRRAAMRDVLQRLTWTDKGVAAKSPSVDDAVSAAGRDLTYFGKALATFSEKTMAPIQNNERIGVAEWFFPAQEMAKVLGACPRFTDTPDGARLREARMAAGNTMPEWVRACEFRTDKERYLAEIWFMIVPDTAITAWLQKK